MAVSFIAATPVQNPATTTNTSLAVTLASTTVGDLNIIEVSGLANGTTINPTMATPSGWTKLGEQLDTNGTPASFIAIYYRTFQSGDPTSVTISWANAGQMVAVCRAHRGCDATTPIADSHFDFKVASDVNYSIADTTTATGWLCYGFANRTGAAWSGLSDSLRATSALTSSATMVSLDTNGDVAAGSYTKTGVGSNTSVGVSWAYRLVAGSATPTTGFYVYDGSAWNRAVPYLYNGTTWNVADVATA
jgi:hypothetical protein